MVPIYGESFLAVAVTVNFSPAFLAVLVAATSKYFDTVALSHTAIFFLPGIASPDVTTITGSVPPVYNFIALFIYTLLIF